MTSHSQWRRLVPRFHISLRTLLVCVTTACVAFAWFAYEYARSQRELRAAKQLADLGVEVSFDPSVDAALTLTDTVDSPPDQASYLEQLFPAARWAGLRNDRRVNDGIAQRLRSFSRLKSLQIEMVNVSDAGIAVVAELPQLAVLVIDDVNVTDEGLYRICRGSHLRYLYIGQCEITNRGLSSLEFLSTDLTELGIRGSWLTDEGVKGIARCRGLRALSLSDTSISDVGVEAIAEIQTIEHIYLSDTEVSDIGVGLLTSLENLKTLHLERTRVTDNCLVSIARFPRLRWLRLYDCAVSTEAVTRFKALAPSVQVQYSARAQ